MSNKLPFFKFDCDAWLTGKIQLLKANEKGIFIDLIARIWKENGFLKNDEILHRLIRVEKATLSDALQAFFDLGIMEEKEGFLCVKFIDEQINDRKEFAKKQSEFGAKGGRPKKGTKANKKEEKKEEKKGEFKNIYNITGENPPDDKEPEKGSETEPEMDIEELERMFPGYPNSVEDIISIANNRAGTNISPEDARMYLDDRIRRGWKVYGSQDQIKIAAIPSDLRIWVNRTQNKQIETAYKQRRQKLENLKNGRGLSHDPKDFGEADEI